MPRKVRKPNFYENRYRRHYGRAVEKSVNNSVQPVTTGTTPVEKKSLDEVLAEYRTTKGEG